MRGRNRTASAWEYASRIVSEDLLYARPRSRSRGDNLLRYTTQRLPVILGMDR